MIHHLTQSDWLLLAREVSKMGLNCSNVLCIKFHNKSRQSKTAKSPLTGSIWNRPPAKHHLAAFDSHVTSLFLMEHTI